MVWDRTRRAPLVGLLVGIFFGTSAAAQSPDRLIDQSRAQLTARARLADSLHRTEEAFRIRARLQNGDFEVGDRMFATYEGAGLQRADTLMVQAGRIIRLGEPMGDLKVEGLLVSELADSIRGRIDKYFKNEVIHVIPLLRLTVTGAVGAPGFYYARSDARLSELLMRVGGQGQSSDLSKITVKRGEQVLWTPPDVSAALRDGLTLEYLGLETGDEINVGAASTGKGFGLAWMQIVIPLLSALLIRSVYKN